MYATRKSTRTTRASEEVTSERQVYQEQTIRQTDRHRERERERERERSRETETETDRDRDRDRQTDRQTDRKSLWITHPLQNECPHGALVGSTKTSWQMEQYRCLLTPAGSSHNRGVASAAIFVCAQKKRKTRFGKVVHESHIKLSPLFFESVFSRKL